MNTWKTYKTKNSQDTNYCLSFYKNEQSIYTFGFNDTMLGMCLSKSTCDLISCSPEMLKALEQVENALVALDKNHILQQLDIQSLIKKARGLGNE